MKSLFYAVLALLLGLALGGGAAAIARMMEGVG